MGRARRGPYELRAVLGVIGRPRCKQAISDLTGVKDQFFLGKKLQRAVPFRVNGVPETAVDCWKHGDDLAYFMLANRVFNLLANREL